MSPEEEKEELSLIYQAKGIPADQAEDFADRILSNPETAIKRSHVKNWASIRRLLAHRGQPDQFIPLFAIGAALPVIPFMVFSGPVALAVSALVCAFALFVVGAAISVFTGRTLLASGLRMLGIGALAAGITYGIGRLLGVAVTG